MSKKINTKPFYNSTIPSDWEIKELGKLGHFSKGKGILKEQVIESGLPCIRYGEIYTTHDFVVKEFKSFINEDMAKESQPIKKGDILFAGSGETLEEIGKAVAYTGNEKAYAGGDVIILSTNGDSHAEFLSFVLETDFVRRQKRRLGQGHSVVHIYPRDLATLKIPLPPLKERQAIADLLHLLDTAINKNNLLIAKKLLQKTGLMQKLLSGEKRLKGFEKEKWKNYHLGSLGETYTGLTGKSKEDFGGGKPFIPYLNVFFNSSIDTTNFEFVNITANETQNRVMYGDILFTVSSETQDEVGMASVLLENIGELYLNSFCFGFRLNDFNTLNPAFSSYYFRAQAFRKEVYKLSQGATRYNLSKTQLMKLNIILPPINEQKEIAKVLQAADIEIQLLKITTDKLREKKKALMQQLLSGKKRLVPKP